MERVSNNSLGYIRAYDAYYVQKTQQKNTLDEKDLEKGKQEDSIQISEEGLSALEESIASRTKGVKISKCGDD